jgi:hypothetical protein
MAGQKFYFLKSAVRQLIFCLQAGFRPSLSAGMNGCLRQYVDYQPSDLRKPDGGRPQNAISSKNHYETMEDIVDGMQIALMVCNSVANGDPVRRKF